MALCLAMLCVWHALACFLLLKGICPLCSIDECTLTFLSNWNIILIQVPICNVQRHLSDAQKTELAEFHVAMKTAVPSSGSSSATSTAGGQPLPPPMQSQKGRQNGAQEELPARRSAPTKQQGDLSQILCS